MRGGYSIRGGGRGLGSFWDTVGDVVTNPDIWATVTGNQAQAPSTSPTIIYAAPASAPAAKTNYVPWIIGGVAVLGAAGAIAYAASR